MWPFAEQYPEKCCQDVDGKTYDYVIVGGGTAGAVIASKLSEDPNVSVLVLERGSISDTWMFRVPLISSDFRSDASPAITDHRSRPLENRGGFQLSLLSAHILGGNSRINSSISTRGIPGGYNQWAEELGLSDWGWEKVEPYFKRLESSERDDPSRGRSDKFQIHMTLHPSQSMPVTTPIKMSVDLTIISQEKAYSSLGLRPSESINSATTPAQTYAKLEMAIGEQGQRVSSYSAFLNAKLAKERKPHLTVCTNTAVTKLTLSDDGQTVTGVLCRRTRSKGEEKGRPDCLVKVRREVIVCAGAFVSPLILMHSGIGPANILEKHGIPQIKELPVGRTLQDHLLFGITLEVPQSETIHALLNSIFLALWHFLSYIIWGTGLLAGPPTPRAAWIKTSHLDEKTMEVKQTDRHGNSTSDPLSKNNIPDVEIMSLSCSILDRNLPGYSVISLLNCLAQPKSNGTLELASNNPEDYADVSFPYLTDNADVIAARKSMRFTMRVADEFLKNSGYPHRASILTAPSINRLPKDWEKSDFGEVKRLAITPDPSGRAKPLPSAMRAIIPRSEVEKTWETVTDEEIDTYVRNTAISGNHPASTCRMSVDPRDGVVDQRFRVHGMKNLRVADASALPKLPTGHLMLPVMMFGLRCADFVREDWEGYGH